MISMCINGFEFYSSNDVWQNNVLRWRKVLATEATTGGVLQKKMFLDISQNTQENICA